MSEENVKIVRRMMDAWNRQDIETMREFADPEVEYVNAPSAVEPGTRQGHEALERVVRIQWEAIPGAQQDLERVHDRGDEVISESLLSRSMPGSDARITQPILMSWKFRNGTIVQIEILGAGPEFQQALEAAGLAEDRNPG
jgi:ketosteroid isomerase-like protein